MESNRSVPLAQIKPVWQAETFGFRTEPETEPVLGMQWSWSDGEELESGLRNIGEKLTAM